MPQLLDPLARAAIANNIKAARFGWRRINARQGTSYRPDHKPLVATLKRNALTNGLDPYHRQLWAASLNAAWNCKHTPGLSFKAPKRVKSI